MLLNLTMQPLGCGIIRMALDKAFLELCRAEEESDLSARLFLTFISLLSVTLRGKPLVLIVFEKSELFFTVIFLLLF